MIGVSTSPCWSVGFEATSFWSIQTFTGDVRDGIAVLAVDDKAHQASRRGLGDDRDVGDNDDGVGAQRPSVASTR